MKGIGEISVSAAPRAGFREFSSCKEREQGSRGSLNIGARRGGGTDCAPFPAHRLAGRSPTRLVSRKMTVPFPRQKRDEARGVDIVRIVLRHFAAQCDSFPH